MKSIFRESDPCSLCGLHKGAKTPRMRPSGSSDPEYYILGEGPGKQEDDEGYQFVETAVAGGIIREIIDELGIGDVCRFNNSIRCRPPKNRDPQAYEVGLCRPSVAEDIYKFNPKVIIALGNYAMMSLYPKKKASSIKIMMYNGRIIPNWEFECWVAPVYHPSFVHRKRWKDHKKGDYDMVFENDIQMAVELDYLSKSPDIITPDEFERGLRPILDWDGIEHFFEKLMKHEDTYAFDYETVGLRPFTTLFKLVSISFCFDPGLLSYSFPIDKIDAPWSESQRKRIKRWLKEAFKKKGVTKIAHNLKFEHEVTFVELGVNILGKLEDTQLMAYTLDERSAKNFGAHSLGFLAHSLFGFEYKSETDQYIHNMDECPMDLLLRHNALDSKVAYHVYKLLKKRMGYKLRRTYKIFAVGPTPMLSRSQAVGVKVDKEKLRGFEDTTLDKINEIESDIRELDCMSDFKREFGYAPNLNGEKDIKSMLYDTLDLEPVKYTKKENISIDADALKIYSDNGIEFCTLLLQQREYTSLYNNRIKSTQKFLWPDGRLHTNWNNSDVSTGRTSSSKPNLQNFDVRKHPEVRSVIIADPGHFLISADYSQIEARNIAMASRCKAFCDAIRNDYDIHYDWGERLFQKKFKKDPKGNRQLVKNQFVFPSFYGAMPPSIAKALDLSEDFVRRMQNALWAMFPGVKEWQEGLFDFYYDNLYVETLTGRRRHAPLSTNQILNTPIQGTASDFLIWSAKQLDKKGYTPLLLVHDEVVVQCLEADLDRTLDVVHDTMTSLPKNIFPYVNVPVDIDMSIGYDWYEMEDVKEGV